MSNSIFVFFIEIDIDGAYRSLETQENIFLDYMKKYGIDYAEEIVAMPGTSEHHTGQALDLVIKKDGKCYCEPNFYHILKRFSYMGEISLCALPREEASTYIELDFVLPENVYYIKKARVLPLSQFI